MYLCPKCKGWRNNCLCCDKQGTIQPNTLDLFDIVPAYPLTKNIIIKGGALKNARKFAKRNLRSNYV